MQKCIVNTVALPDLLVVEFVFSPLKNMLSLLGLFSEEYSLGTTLLETRILKFSMKYLAEYRV